MGGDGVVLDVFWKFKKTSEKMPDTYILPPCTPFVMDKAVVAMCRQCVMTGNEL